MKVTVVGMISEIMSEKDDVLFKIGYVRYARDSEGSLIPHLELSECRATGEVGAVFFESCSVNDFVALSGNLENSVVFVDEFTPLP